MRAAPIATRHFLFRLLYHLELKWPVLLFLITSTVLYPKQKLLHFAFWQSSQLFKLYVPLELVALIRLALLTSIETISTGQFYLLV
jgi:hypothetical protein